MSKASNIIMQQIRNINTCPESTDKLSCSFALLIAFLFCSFILDVFPSKYASLCMSNAL